MIMDMLGSEEARTAILSHYQKSDEPEAISEAIEEACRISAASSDGGLRQRWT